MSTPVLPSDLVFIAGINNADTLARRLAASPSITRGQYPLRAFFNSASAADAFNAAIDHLPPQCWAVWVHQDVYLPDGWPERFLKELNTVRKSLPELAVAGVYGVRGHGDGALRAGHVLDRGIVRHEPLSLPCEVDSLDELLVAVRVGSGLRMDPQLGYDFYGTDLVLEAQARGLKAVAVDAFCEHWSDTPAAGPVAAGVLQRIAVNAEAFERKWAARLPVTTPCFDIRQPGDVARFLQQLPVSEH